MIPLMKVHTPPNIGKVLQRVWDSGFITEGEYSDRFEEEFGKYIGNSNVSLTNSCTSALLLAGHMCDIKPGDEVITTAMTCMATNIPFYNLGAKLIFADIEKDTGNIDVKDIENKIILSEGRVKAIVMVHWAGQPCELEEINKLAKKYNIKTIEDAAHALRSTYKDIKIGNHSDYVCFSFQAVKHLTTADGGAIACKNEKDVVRIRKLRWFGLDRKYEGKSRWAQDIPEVGHKVHMNNMNAVIGLEQLKYIDDIIDKHIENGNYYDKFINNPKIEKLRRVKEGNSSYWIYSLLVEDKEDLQKHLNDNGIASDIVHIRNDLYSCFEEFQCEMPNLEYFNDRLLNIPVGWWVSNKERKHIVSVLNAY